MNIWMFRMFIYVYTMYFTLYIRIRTAARSKKQKAKSNSNHWRSESYRNIRISLWLENVVRINNEPKHHVNKFQIVTKVQTELHKQKYNLYLLLYLYVVHSCSPSKHWSKTPQLHTIVVVDVKCAIYIFRLSLFIQIGTSVLFFSFVATSSL